MTAEELFLSELPLIESVCARVCRRHCLRGEDAEDFGSTVKLRLIENDYAILGRFQGRASLKTYLTAVINHVYLDYQARRFGKWRPSAEARRLGAVALRLECLLYRDRLGFDEACGVLQGDFQVAESREALLELSHKLRCRTDRRPAPGYDLEPGVAEDGASAVERQERQALADKTFGIIRRSLCRLPARDRIILRLHVEEGLSVAQISVSLGEEPKGLYRKKDAIYARLRADLEAEGIGPADVQQLLATLDWEACLTGDVAPSKGGQ